MTYRGDDIFILGGGNHGVAYGVYPFLEQELGYRHFSPWPGGEHILQTPDVTPSGRELRERPGILINNRSMLPEDFSTPEDVIQPQPFKDGRGWEACMTYNHVRGYMPSVVDWRTNREVLDMLNHCAAYDGNLLLNVGPQRDGGIPAQRRMLVAFCR